jgi:tetratricopeptide (TPR) repeat protein
VGEASVLNELALIAHQRGQLDAAFERCTQALDLIDRHTMALRRPVMLTLQASVRLDQARVDEALALAQASLAEVQRVGARSHAPALHRLLAEVLLALGRPAEAVEHLRTAVQMLDTLNSSLSARGLLCSCASFAWATGRASEAAFFSLCAEARRPARATVLPRYRLLHERVLGALAAGELEPLQAQAREVDAPALLQRIAQLLAN